tara:strand:+ start:4165 stop:4707 length:543 start_codon:yes stop_codon:yes gene_type:complete
MSVLNVLDTQTISASGSGYIVVKTGVIRCYCAAASSIQIDAGPAITLAAGEAILVYCGKPKHAKIASATGANPAVLTIQGYSNGGRHTFSANDYIETVDGGDTDGFVAAFESAASGGKKVASATATTITTDIDASSASNYALSAADATAGNIPQVSRAVKLTAGSGSGGVIVEQVQVVGG